MASLSERLRRERELRGISLKQIAEETKITVRFLEALEDDRLEMIPGEFYRRSYLRAYARYLGLDEERALNAYAMAHGAEAGNVDVPVETVPEESALPAWTKSGVVVFLVSSLALMGYLIGQVDGEGASSSTIPATSPVLDSSAGEPGAASGGSTNAAVPPAFGRVAEPDSAFSQMEGPAGRGERLSETRSVPSRGGLEIGVNVEEQCWLQVHVDGELVEAGVKERGERLAWSAASEVRLWLGNAGGVSVSLNGAPARRLGASGEVRRDVLITRDNYRSFLLGEHTR